MNTKLRTEAKNDFEKNFFKLMNNAVFGKTMENVRKHRDIKLVTTDKRRNQFASELYYHTKKHFSKNLMATEMKKAKVKMNKPIYLGMSILDTSKTLIYEFWYDTLNQKNNGVELNRVALNNVALKTEQNYVTWTLTALLFILKLKIFIKTLLMMLKNGLTHLIMMKMIIDRLR